MLTFIFKKTVCLFMLAVEDMGNMKTSRSQSLSLRASDLLREMTREL